MSLSIDFNNLVMFTEIIHFMADLAFEIEDIDSAAYLYNECVI